MQVVNDPARRHSQQLPEPDGAGVAGAVGLDKGEVADTGQKTEPVCPGGQSSVDVVCRFLRSATAAEAMPMTSHSTPEIEPVIRA